MALDGYTDQILSRQARKAELLDPEAERELARAWRDDGDKAALHRLVTAYVRLAIAMAAKLRRYGASMNDLTQEAAIGLMKAAEKFGPDRGVRFSTFAIWRIMAQLQDHVMRYWSLVRKGSTTAQKSLLFTLRRVEARLRRVAAGRSKTLEGDSKLRTIAPELGVTLAEAAMMDRRLSGSDAALNDLQSNDEDGRVWIDVLEDETAHGAEIVAQSHDAAVLRGSLGRALRELSDRERLIARAAVD